MPQVRGEPVYAVVSALVSAGDGVGYDFTAPQPPPLNQPQALDGRSGAGVSNPQIDLLEALRRTFTKITSPSATLASGGSAGSIVVGFGNSGIQGIFMGVPFILSGTAATMSGSPTSAASTASNEVRKILVCIGMSALPVASSMGLAGGTVQFTYGPAVRTSANVVNSGGLTVSYWDYVPMPRPSANEIPVGWLNIPNSFSTSAGINASHMFTDYRVTQGINFSAMMP